MERTFRTLGEKMSSGNTQGTAIGGTTAADWYRKSLDVLLRSEKIERAWDDRYRRQNQKIGDRGFTSIPAVLYFAMGNTYVRLADPHHALAAFERGRILGADPDLLEQLAYAYRATGDLRSAALALTEALAMDSGRERIVPSLVELYSEIDPDGCSIQRGGAAPSVDVRCPLVHSDICAAWKNAAGTYAKSRQPIEAASIRRTAVQELGCAPAMVN